MSTQTVHRALSLRSFVTVPPEADPPQEVAAMVVSQGLGFTVTSDAITEVAAKEIIARPTRSAGATHLLSTAPWTWEQLRDYVNGECDRRWGARPHDPLRESGIFKGFVSRWGDQAEAIARAAFDLHNGMWRGAPISASRFTANSDPYFAAIIASTL